MTDSPALTPVVDNTSPARLVAQRLRNTLRLNAATSGFGGLLAAVAAGALDGWLGAANGPIVRAVGVGLVAFAGAVVAVAGSRTSRLTRWAPAIIVGDFAWVAASVATIVAGWYSTVGNVIIAAVALMVAAFAVRQTSSLRHLKRIAPVSACIDESPPIEVAQVQREIAGDRAHAWSVITDHGLYGRLAPNLGSVRVIGGEGTGMRRTCTNRGGDEWNETCTLWDDQHRFEVNVDTGNYPYPLQIMRGSWWVTAAGEDRVTVGMDFRFQPARTLRGRAFAVAMHAAFPVVLSRILNGWEREIARRSQR